MKTVKLLPLLSLVLSLAVTVNAQTEIVGLSTDYQQSPVGLDNATPTLGWKMLSDKYGAAQTAYRVVAALSERQLAEGDYCHDSGRIEGAGSVAIPYGGTLRPATRYHWKVFVWNENGRMTASEPAWFETGLMGTGWSGARWIGSNETILSMYRTDFVIDYDVRALDGEATFVFGARDAGNFIGATLDVAAGSFRLSHTTDGMKSEAASEDVSALLAGMSRDATHHVRLDVSCSGGSNYSVRVALDGRDIGPSDRPYRIVLHEPNSYTNLDRLYRIGYDQPAGKRAELSGIAVSERRWGTTFTADNGVVAAEGFRIWDPTNASAPMIRKTIDVRGEVARARLYATARGIYEFEINGAKVGTDYFNPGWTVYDDRIMYNTFDVTGMLKTGRNGLGAVLGAGWWNDFVGMWVDPYGVAQSMMAKLVVEYEDGGRDVFVTDGSWRVWDDGPVIGNGMQTGQEYDARKEVPGWSGAEFDDGAWSDVKVFDAPKPNVVIEAYVGETIKNHETLTAAAMTEPRKGVYIYDMGKNMVGIPRLTNLRGAAGQRVTLRFAEMLWPEVMPKEPVPPYTSADYEKNRGLMYTDNYREALSRDAYIMKGDPRGETFEPSLVQHGYRYVEITGVDTPPALEDVKGLVLHSIGGQTSRYETSNANINKLFENIIWGQRGNFLSVPTDCPQRNERMGWMGDAQVFVRTSTYNMMTDGFFNRWMRSVRDNQGANGSYTDMAPTFRDGGDAMGWMEAGIIVPWQVYQQYGDRRILEDHYASMTRYMDYLAGRARDGVQPGGLFGDWLAMQYTDVSLTNTAYWAYDASLMERVARILGKEDDAAGYAGLYETIKRTWNSTFVDGEGYTKYAVTPKDENINRVGEVMGKVVWDPAHPERIHTQTSYVVPLFAGLFDEENKPRAVRHLVELLEENGYRLSTGFIGTPYLCLVLSDNGRADVAYRLFEQTEFPSWLFPVLQGATTIWERWNSYTIDRGFGPVGMNSFNHYSYGAVEEWMMSRSLGIERDERTPGYKHFNLQPQIGGSCDYIRGGFESVYGEIASGWEKRGDGSYTYSATVPANTTATLTLESSAVSKVALKKGRAGVSKFVLKDGKVTCELKAGEYLFEVKR